MTLISLEQKWAKSAEWTIQGSVSVSGYAISKASSLIHCKFEKQWCVSMILHFFCVRSSISGLTRLCIMLICTKTIVIANCKDKRDLLNQVLFPYTNIYISASHQTTAYRLSAIH